MDRIASIPEVIEKKHVPAPKNFNVAEYTKQVFYMYDGEQVEVDLKVDNSLIKIMIDRFGEDVTTLAYDMKSFRVITKVVASPSFYGWIFGFSGKIQILGPDSVKKEYLQMIKQAYENLNK